MNMTKCPQCDRQRKGEEYKCPDCDCFYSPLDEILAAEAAEIEKRSFVGRFKASKKESNFWGAVKKEYKRLDDTSPYNVSLILMVIVMFIFAMTLSVL